MTRAPLSQLSDFKLVDEHQDIRGRAVRDEEGRDLGTVRYLIVNTDAEEVDTIVLENGQEFPVEAIDVRDDHVIVRAQHAGVSTAERFRMRCTRGMPGR